MTHGVSRAGSPDVSYIACVGTSVKSQILLDYRRTVLLAICAVVQSANLPSYDFCLSNFLCECRRQVVPVSYQPATRRYLNASCCSEAGHPTPSKGCFSCSPNVSCCSKAGSTTSVPDHWSILPPIAGCRKYVRRSTTPMGSAERTHGTSSAAAKQRCSRLCPRHSPNHSIGVGRQRSGAKLISA